MAATLTDKRFAGPEWIFERKLDGIRLLAFKNGRSVELFSRNRLPQHSPPIAGAIANLPPRELILDGEVTGIWGPASTREADRPRGFAYHVFDILWIDGRDVTSLPLDQRHALLKTLPLRSPLRRVAALDDEKPWERACAEGWEGVIAKRRDSVYEHRRSPHWLKMKCEASQELVIGGFTDPQGARVGLGALLVGFFAPRQGSGHHDASISLRVTPSTSRGERDSKGDGDEFVFAGKVGTGFDTKLLLDLRAKLDRLEIGKPPFTKATGLPRLRAHWVRPEIVVQVAFTEWTVHDKLRHPRLLGIRPDKTAREVVRERP
jgi:bifunctional non-homologous end joining protein LigD